MYQPTGTELIEIRHHARLSQFLEAPLAPFANTPPAPVLQTFLNLIVEINPFSNIELDNIREWMGVIRIKILNKTPSNPLSL